MAVGQHKLSRRALLGAVCALPVLSEAEGPFARHPGLDDWAELSPGEFIRGPNHESMNAAGHQARASVSMDSGLRRNDGVAAAKWARALACFAAAEAGLAAAAGAPDAVYDPLGARHEAALQRLLRTPAPDVAALARKLELALDERSGEFFGDEGAMKAMKLDARRLAASPG